MKPAILIDPAQYLSLPHAARLVGVSYEAVRQRCNAGKLERIAIGGHPYVRRAACVDWIAERATYTYRRGPIPRSRRHPLVCNNAPLPLDGSEVVK